MSEAPTQVPGRFGVMFRHRSRRDPRSMICDARRPRPAFVASRMVYSTGSMSDDGQLPPNTLPAVSTASARSEPEPLRT
jgi:hypothetical protein